jgi:hypothetical protein
MSLTIFGETDMVRVSRAPGWSAERGDYLTEVWVGTRTAAEAYFTAAKGSGNYDDVRLEITKGRGTVTLALTADTTAGGFPVDPEPVWELIGQDATRDLRAFGGGTAAGVAFNAAADQADLEAVRRTIETATFTTLPAGDPDLTYAKLLLRGTVEFIRSTAILRSTLTVNSRTVATLNWHGTDRAWKLNGELGSPNPPGTGSSGILGAIADMPDYDGSKKQWLKRAPQIRSLDRGRFQLTHEWWFSKRWSYVLYEGDNEADNP